MKRHSFALTILLASLAGPLVTVGSARCRAETPNFRNQCQVCPILQEQCNDYLYYCDPAIAAADYDNDPLDPRFDPETGRYIGHDEVNPIVPAVETVEAAADLDAFYAACEDTCNAEVQEAYTSQAVVEVEPTAADLAPEAAAETSEAEAERYNEEYYDVYADEDYNYADEDYNYDYESYDYDYESDDYWYEQSAAVQEVPVDEAVAETTEVEPTTDANLADQATTEAAVEDAYQDSYDYSYDEYDNYDYEYETYDYEAPAEESYTNAEAELTIPTPPPIEEFETEIVEQDTAEDVYTDSDAEFAVPMPSSAEETVAETLDGPEVRDYEAEVAVEALAAEQAAKAAEQEAVAADAWDYEAEGYDPYDYEAYEYDYEAYEYEYEVAEEGAVATPVEESASNLPEEQLTSEHEANFADTWTDGVDTADMYSWEYDYGIDAQPVVEAEAEVEVETTAQPSERVAPLAAAATRSTLLGTAELLDRMSQLLKNASLELERTASLGTNWR